MRIIWNSLGLYISRNLRMGRGVNIPKFGIFTFTPPEVRLKVASKNNIGSDKRNRKRSASKTSRVHNPKIIRQRSCAKIGDLLPPIVWNGPSTIRCIRIKWRCSNHKNESHINIFLCEHV
jgi:hypothetical protein